MIQRMKTCSDRIRRCGSEDRSLKKRWCTGPKMVHILHIWVYNRVFTMGNVRPSDCQLTVEYFAQPTDVCLAGMILDWGFHQKESQNQPENTWRYSQKSNSEKLGCGFPHRCLGLDLDFQEWSFVDGGLSLGGVKWRSWFLKKASSRKKIDMVQLCSIYHNFSWNLLFCLFFWLLWGLDLGRSFSATARYHIHQLRGQCGTPHQSIGPIWMRGDVVTTVWGVYRCL